MKKIKSNYIKYALKIAGITALTIICFVLAHKAATVQRGYDALGGELAFLLLPFFLWVAPKLTETAEALGGASDDVD